jgi:Fe-S cluster assembly scaffold protein SufB
MEYYQSFLSEAQENYATLPDEKSELYKRYSVNVPLEEFSKRINLKPHGAGKGEAEELCKELKEKLGIVIDVTIDGSVQISDGASRFVRSLDVHGLTEEALKQKMFSNRESKQVAFIHAHTKEILQIEIPSGETAGINMLFTNSDTPLVTQVLIKAGKGSKLNLLEWYGSKATKESMVNVMHEVSIQEYAKTEINMIHNEDWRTFSAGSSKFVIGDNAELEFNSIYNGGLLTKVKSEVISEGYASKSRITEMVMGSSTQVFDINTTIVNANRDTASELESKGALADQSRCLLKGFADIRENAPGSRSFVHERGILLSKDARMDSIPGMSIKNSDVKATHSSAVAPVDEEALFYLMSRGASLTDARLLLVSGFFSGSLSKITDSTVKEAVASLIHEKIYTKSFGSVPKATMSGLWTESRSESSIFKGHYKYRDE